jgi:hypothetical protein
MLRSGTNRLLVHLLRFAVLAIGLLVVGELVIAFLTCQDVKYVSLLQSVGSCLAGTIFYLYYFVPYVLPFHLIPVGCVALLATIYWAWRHRNR